ncbi:MAG TPA: squalene--hopene cyclase [Pirellulales bacterium]|jgi:hypothetical protein|nr:squalene--hopene cyclase [Pirellulales bacterium]
MAAVVPNEPNAAPRDLPDGVSPAAKPQYPTTATAPAKSPALASPGNSAEAVDREETPGGIFGLVQNAPAWLFSAAIHTSLLIILVCLAVAGHRSILGPASVRLAGDASDSLSLEDSPVVADRGTQLIEQQDSGVFLPQNLPAIDFSLPRNLPAIDIPLVAPTRPADFRLAGGPASSGVGVPVVRLAVNGREAAMKGALLGAYGGTDVTEAAVAHGLEWLIRHQERGGWWNLGGSFADHVSHYENQCVATGMALLAFQGAGITPHKGKYARDVERAWKELLKRQRPDGSFLGPSSPISDASCGQAYSHAICTIALCEILAMTRDKRFEEPARHAVAFCLASQDKQKGGWRYNFKPATDSDTSVTGWFVMALKSAQMAGLEVPPDIFENVSRYLDSVAMPDGQYSYFLERPASGAAITAEAYLCRQLLGWRKDDSRLVNGCKRIAAHPIKFRPGRDVYYWYYGTQVCHNMEGEIWDTWNRAMRSELPENQVQSGEEAGSWDSKGDQWGLAGGRLYTTCLSIYCLEVYYRHLPIYSAYKYGK